jgi:predicted transcriptional regulator
MALESVEEHQIVKQLLQELAESDQDEQWEAKLKVLQENVEHHVQEEEKEIFKKAQKVLSKDRIKELGERAKEQKETEMTRH